MDKIKIGGIMQSDGRAFLKIMAIPKEAAAAASICSALAATGINIEFMAQSLDIDDAVNLALVVDHKDLDPALSLLESVKAGLQAKGLSYVPDVAIISVFGPHLREKPMVPSLMFGSLASVDVVALAIANSISSVSCVVEGRNLNLAPEALTEVFDVPFSVAKRPKDW
ncbi:MAG: ACT domain-containing protein [Deltaproteobacteria bacterium]|nr:ACT domain-containing protein [Deltaproteobacteria bacterium]